MLRLIACVCVLGMSGCAAWSDREIDETATRSAATAREVGSFLGSVGVPGAELVATGVAGVLAAIGFGARSRWKAQAEAERQSRLAVDAAWDEATARAVGSGVPPVRPRNTGGDA